MPLPPAARGLKNDNRVEHFSDIAFQLVCALTHFLGWLNVKKAYLGAVQFRFSLFSAFKVLVFENGMVLLCIYWRQARMYLGFGQGRGGGPQGSHSIRGPPLTYRGPKIHAGPRTSLLPPLRATHTSLKLRQDLEARA